VLFLRNYGVLVTGESVEEAFLTAANVVAAVDTQVAIIRDQLNSRFHGRDIFREIGLLP